MSAARSSPPGGTQPSAPRPLAHYEALVAVAEQQLERAAAGDTAALERLAVAWDELAAAAPATPPAEAGPALARAALLIERTRSQLEATRTRLDREIARVARSTRAARGYAAQGAPGASVDRRV
jgi:hypothetical protein